MRAFLLVAFASTGCIQIQAEIEETCIARHDLEIEGVPLTMVTRDITIEDMSDVHKLLEYDAELEFVRADIRPKSGVTNLDFVQSASFSIEGTPIYACDGNCSVDNGVALLSSAHANATPYLSADSLVLGLAVTGELPKETWSVDVDVCVRGKLAYEASL